MNDLKYALRQLCKRPGFAFAAVLTLALGIGANTAIFSVVNAVLLRPLPYADPSRLVAVCESNPARGWDQYVTSLGAYADWRTQSSAFQTMAAATVLGPTTVIGQGEPHLVDVAAVSAEFFALLGVQPVLGRLFVAEEESPERGDVVLLSEGLWRERFGADPDIVNRDIRLGDRTFTVVGVMPASVKLFDPVGVQGWERGFSKSDLWRPLPVNSGLQDQRNYRAFLVLGRLKPGVSIAQAQAEMTHIAGEQARAYPEAHAGWDVTVQPWHQIIVRSARMPLVLLFGAVGLVLLIATANVANLCLGRVLSRQNEFGVRMALGAGPLRLAWQSLMECLLLSALGGAAGLVLGQGVVHLIIGLMPSDIPRVEEIRLDGRVFAFAFALALAVGVFLSLAFLSFIERTTVFGSLKTGMRNMTGSVGRHRLRAALVASQVALSVVLLTGAGLLMQSLRHLHDVDPGFRQDRLVALDVLLNSPGDDDEPQRIRFVEQLLTRLADQPGLDAFAAVDGLPLDAGHAGMNVALTDIEGVNPSPPGEQRVAGLRLVSPAYFRTLGIALSKGRFFTARDDADSRPVVIVNEALAQRYFPDRDPVGQRISSPDFGAQACDIVGVVKDVRHVALDEAAQPEVFRPLLQQCFSSITLVAYGASAPAPSLVALRHVVSDVGGTRPVYNPRTVEQLRSASLAPRRFALRLMGLFALLALTLALIGIYGVLACTVNESIREIGIRLTLGAQRHEVLGRVLLRGMRSVAWGGLVGLAGAWALTRFLRSLLYEVTPTDPLTYVSVIMLLIAMAFLACWLPARRASRVDPMEALRHE